jgi:hypothetical protein
MARGLAHAGAGDAQSVFDAYRRDGYFYRPKPSNPGNTGVSFYSPAKIFALVERFPDLKVTSYAEGGWGNHHDIVTCLKGDWHYP